jgi:hypothetical protein
LVALLLPSPLFWADYDLKLLRGTTVFDLTMMMRKQITRDYERLILPLLHKHPGNKTKKAFVSVSCATGVRAFVLSKLMALVFCTA